jgi:hypothetical protein
VDLSDAQRLKLHLLAEGMSLSPTAASHLAGVSGDTGLSAADYASTSGIILKLEDDVWVNAPVHQYNPNFVTEAPPNRLDLEGGELVVTGSGLTSTAAYCPQPAFHSATNQYGPLTNFVLTHADRARLSPIRSCAMVCEFCNLPYDDPIQAYTLKPIAGCLEALRVAAVDPVQPARHILISGGTPKPKDVGFHRELYRQVLDAFPDLPVDIMMVPIKGVLDVQELKAHGVAELSINIEVYSRERAKVVARAKYHQGLALYLDFIEQASAVLGPGRVRSMLLVGLEPLEDTLRGVEAVAERGGVPVLSPFRPDPATPLRDMAPPGYDDLIEALSRASEMAARYGVYLGPTCPPCSHNTLSFAADAAGQVHYQHPEPVVVR